MHKRNKIISIRKYDESISMFNAKYHPYLETGLFTLGQSLNSHKRLIDHHNIIFKLEGTEAPGNLIKEELEKKLKRIMKKLDKLKSCNIHLDKLKLFVAQSKGNIGKICNFAIIDNF